MGDGQVMSGENGRGTTVVSVLLFSCHSLNLWCTSSSLRARFYSFYFWASAAYALRWDRSIKRISANRVTTPTVQHWEVTAGWAVLDCRHRPMLRLWRLVILSTWRGTTHGPPSGPCSAIRGPFLGRLHACPASAFVFFPFLHLQYSMPSSSSSYPYTSFTQGVHGVRRWWDLSAETHECGWTPAEWEQDLIQVITKRVWDFEKPGVQRRILRRLEGQTDPDIFSSDFVRPQALLPASLASR